MLLASFIAPFFNPALGPTQQQNDENGGRFQKRLSQRERKALRSKLSRSQHGEKFLVEVQSRAKRISHSGWTVTPERHIGEIKSWNQRSAYGFIEHDEFESEIVLYARDIDSVPEEYDSGQKKANWCGFRVEFEMRYDNQPRAINAKILDGWEASKILREEKNSFSIPEDEYWSDGERSWSDDTSSTMSMPQQASRDGDGSPKRKSGVKVKSTRSRRSLARDAEMDLKEWQEEKEKTRSYFYTTEFRRKFGRDPDYDDFETVNKRRKGHKLKLEREREQWKKTRKVKYLNDNPRSSQRTVARTTTTAVRVPPAAPVPKAKWVAPKKDTHSAILYKMFERIASTTPALQSRDVVQLTVQKLYEKIIVSENLKKHINASTTNKEPLSECPVCFTEFSVSDEKSDEKSEAVKPPRMFNCEHAHLCFDCLQRYISLKISSENEILPWISCPAEKCRAPIHFSDLLSASVCGIPTSDLYTFCRILLQKQLSRSPQFVECSGKVDGRPCVFGFFCEKGVAVRRTCKCCGLAQDVTPKSPEEFLDDGFKSMLRSGALRLCPSCSHPAMKDYGMCNVMECGKCGIFWNWRSKDTGSTYNQVKENGRRYGTLWESGELSYQLNLQQTNPTAFKQLLERNGIKYDPNFVRGRS